MLKREEVCELKLTTKQASFKKNIFMFAAFPLFRHFKLRWPAVFARMSLITLTPRRNSSTGEQTRLPRCCYCATVIIDQNVELCKCRKWVKRICTCAAHHGIEALEVFSVTSHWHFRDEQARWAWHHRLMSLEPLQERWFFHYLEGNGTFRVSMKNRQSDRERKAATITREKKRFNDCLLILLKIFLVNIMRTINHERTQRKGC